MRSGSGSGRGSGRGSGSDSDGGSSSDRDSSSGSGRGRGRRGRSRTVATVAASTVWNVHGHWARLASISRGPVEADSPGFCHAPELTHSCANLCDLTCGESFFLIINMNMKNGMYEQCAKNVR